MKKKLLSLALALVMCLSLAVPAFAAEDEELNEYLKNQEHIKISKDPVGWVRVGGIQKAVPTSEAEYMIVVVIEDDTTIQVIIPEGQEDQGRESFLDLIDTSTAYVEETLSSFSGTAKSDGIYAYQFESDTLPYITESYAAQLESKGFSVDEISTEEVSKLLGATDEEEPAGTPEAPAAPVNPFTDVAESSPFYQAILWAVDEGITNGTTPTTFGPSNTCTVSHILTFLWRANGKPGAAEGTSDAASAAAWAVERELIAEDQDVSVPCTRAMAVTFMWKAAGSPEADASKLAFTDFAAEDSFAPAIAWAVENKVTSGTSETTFSPGNTCTRGQIVTFLYRAASAASASAENSESGAAE